MSGDSSQLDKPESKPLNCDRDAARWAREFNDVLAKQYNLRVDEGWLLSWFANAIMCGEDTYRWKLEASAKAPFSLARQDLPPIHRAEWDGRITFESDCVVNGYPVKAGTTWGPFEKSRSIEAPAATAMPDAWLEITADGEIIGVSRDDDDRQFLPKGWRYEPLYRSAGTSSVALRAAIHLLKRVIGPSFFDNTLQEQIESFLRGQGEAFETGLPASPSAMTHNEIAAPGPTTFALSNGQNNRSPVEPAGAAIPNVPPTTTRADALQLSKELADIAKLIPVGWKMEGRPRERLTAIALGLTKAHFDFTSSATPRREYHPNLDGPAEPVGLAMPDSEK